MVLVHDGENEYDDVVGVRREALQRSAPRPSAGGVDDDDDDDEGAYEEISARQYQMRSAPPVRQAMMRESPVVYGSNMGAMMESHSPRPPSSRASQVFHL